MNPPLAMEVGRGVILVSRCEAQGGPGGINIGQQNIGQQIAVGQGWHSCHPPPLAEFLKMNCRHRPKWRL